MRSWTASLPLTLMVLMSCHLGPAQTKAAKHGSRISGKKLTGVSPIKERHANSPVQCLSLCVRQVNCTAFNFNIASDINCQLFEERACPHHQLVVDPSVNYYDVCDRPMTNQQLSSLASGKCVEEGYSCRDDGEECAEDCSYPTVAPPGAYRCSNGSCQTTEDFWEVRRGFALPRGTNITLHPWIETYKKLKNDTCSLDVQLKLGVDAHVELKLVGAQHGARLTFRVSETTTDLLSSVPILSGVNTTGMVNAESFSHLKLSWCGGTMAIGPAADPALVSGQTGEVGEIAHLAGTSSGPESHLQVDSGVADAWLFEEQGTGADPVFSIGRTMIARRIEPSVDVTVRYDCRAESHCGAYFRSGYPHMLTVFVGAWSNSASGLAYDEGRSPYYNYTATGPILSHVEWNTFTVRYNDGSVTIYRNGTAEPIFDVTAPTLLPPITSVGIGSMHWGSWKEVRVARYDPAWRTDTWRTDGTGFSNMDTKLYAP